MGQSSVVADSPPDVRNWTQFIRAVAVGCFLETTITITIKLSYDAGGFNNSVRSASLSLTFAANAFMMNSRTSILRCFTV